MICSDSRRPCYILRLMTSNCTDGRLFLFCTFFFSAFQYPGGVVKAAQHCPQLAKVTAVFLTDGGGGGVPLLAAC